jgi:hypothetical protein
MSGSSDVQSDAGSLSVVAPSQDEPSAAERRGTGANSKPKPLSKPSRTERARPKSKPAANPKATTKQKGARAAEPASQPPVPGPSNHATGSCVAPAAPPADPSHAPSSALSLLPVPRLPPSSATPVSPSALAPPVFTALTAVSPGAAALPTPSIAVSPGAAASSSATTVPAAKREAPKLSPHQRAWCAIMGIQPMLHTATPYFPATLDKGLGHNTHLSRLLAEARAAIREIKGRNCAGCFVCSASSRMRACHRVTFIVSDPSHAWCGAIVRVSRCSASVAHPPPTPAHTSTLARAHTQKQTGAPTPTPTQTHAPLHLAHSRFGHALLSACDEGPCALLDVHLHALCAHCAHMARLHGRLSAPFRRTYHLCVCVCVLLFPGAGRPLFAAQQGPRFRGAPPRVHARAGPVVL